jgi:hypothetical protein
MSDDNLQKLFARTWVNNQKPSIQQAVAWVNWCFHQHGKTKLPSLQHLFPKTTNFLGSIKKSTKWRKHVKKGARSLTHHEVKAIANVPIRGDDNRIILPWLRDKLITLTEIHIGYHPVDVERMTLENLEDIPMHRNRETGSIQPLMKIINIKTK